MSGLALPTLAVVMAGLMLLGPLSIVAGGRVGLWGALGLCIVGAMAVVPFLIGGAAAVTLSVPLGLAGQSSILALDGVSALFALLLMVVGAAGAAASLDGPAEPTAPALPVFLGAMALVLLAGDSYALVVGFELMSLASFVLVLTHHHDPAVRAAGVLYLGMAAFAGLCLVAALAFLSGHGASFAAIRAHPPEGWRAAFVLTLVLLGVGSKAGLVPLHVWLPPAHAAAPGPVSALMSGVMTKMALYVLIRLLFDLCGPAQPVWWAWPLLAMGVGSAVLGALRANLEADVKRVLACSTIENVGLIATALGIAMAARAADLSALAGLALGAALLHILGHGLFKTLLFLGAVAIRERAGSAFRQLGGLMQRMPLTGGCLLLGAACLAGLPPSAGFAGEWMLFQSVLGAVRLGGLGVQILVCVMAACLVLATALAACAAVRLVGVALLGRPRSQEAAAAREAGPPMRWAMLGLATLVALVGLLPGLVLAMADPALRLLANTTLHGRAGVLSVAPTVETQGYAPLGVVSLLALAALGVAAVLRARAVSGHRIAPAWACGQQAAPAWLPFGDPRTQISGGGFAQPLRRMLGVSLLGASERVDMPPPGDIRPATYTARWQDPAEVFLFVPLNRLRGHLSGLADRLHFLTVRQALTVMVIVLIAFLVAIALVGQA